MKPSTHRSPLALALTLVSAGLVVGPSLIALPSATAATASVNSLDDTTVTRPDGLVVAGGMTQPVFAAARVIRERIWVETAVDTDADGRHDRVAIDIERPAARGRVASILEASPYWECCQDVVRHPVDVPRLPQERIGDGKGVSVSSAVELQAAQANRAAARTADRYVSRGYASVHAQTIGTADSDGCPTSGDHNETLAVTAVIDWLAGRGRGFHKDGTPAKATWSTGKVGMIGTSYNGTLAQQAATTGVDGLKTIVPVSAISSWYDYYRANGLVVAPGTYQGEDTDILARLVVSNRQKKICEPMIRAMERQQDRVTGDWNRFWQDRDYVRSAGKIKASVFVVHGLKDWNVKTRHVQQFWNVLNRNDVSRKIWWHQDGHGGPSDDDTYTLPNGRTATFDDVVNRWMDHWLYGVDNGIEKEPRVIIQRANRTYRTYRSWPDKRARNRSYSLAALGGTRRVQSFVDAGSKKSAQKLVREPAKANPNRLVYRSRKLTGATRISGTPQVRLKLSVDNRRDANVTALLVDYAPSGKAKIVSRGWTDPQNRTSTRASKPLVKGRFYDLKFGLQPQDYVFAARHRIGLVVISTDFEYTLRPKSGTKISVKPAASRINLPVVG
ncbi:Xaa-Pro dipeptidyl-peptidase [Kineosporia sp. NBRC 101677]|uniref:Xaa-Pro dipeptidyl-peptidase n=1 Tax=Kineosporia sp. NBRC 101677 TaxID=3032197 RepID=UPI0024A50F90|nr:Xaa-Pro dipeptidyl-peptidase [Kineosporia sp. NBRC 101677]GLY19576.1 Xaa-Pro dipeptidyl-peptidase [Kineosporia sp. NBRC 101677]